MGQYRTNLFATTRGNKSAMMPFAKLLWTLVTVCGEFGHMVNSFNFNFLFIKINMLSQDGVKTKDR